MYTCDRIIDILIRLLHFDVKDRYVVPVHEPFSSVTGDSVGVDKLIMRMGISMSVIIIMQLSSVY